MINVVFARWARTVIAAVKTIVANDVSAGIEDVRRPGTPAKQARLVFAL